jgi:heptose I phosphotransferase
MHIVLSPEIKKYFASEPECFNQVMRLRGKVYRHVEGRRTQRVAIGYKKYFIKQHLGIGWKEFFKNLFQFKCPVVSAKQEWLAIQQLQRLGIAVPEMVGYGWRGLNPASRESFLITKELPDSISLEDFCHSWKTTPPAFGIKQDLIKRVARIARILHTHGVNHRDFYICHFLLAREDKTLYLIDLHRAQIRRSVPQRWIIKDLAGLYFSAKDIGLTQRDLLRFIKEYSKKSLRDSVIQDATFWEKVKTRGEKLYCKHAS